MGDKVTVDNITNIENNSGIPTINENFDTVADEFDLVHYRDGSQAATGTWDMDSNRLINLPAPGSNTEPLRLADFVGAVTDTALSIILATGVGSTLVGWIAAGADAVLRTVQDKLRDVVSVKDFGAVGDGITDDTVAFQNAVDSIPSTGGTLFVPRGTYLITSTVDIGTKSNVIIKGDGRGHGTGGNATILFAPTSHDTCFHFGGYDAINFQSAIYDLTFISADITFEKIAVHLEDCSEFSFERNNVGGSGSAVVPGLYRYWMGGARGSIAIKTNGRDLLHIRRNRIAAQRPLVFSLNPSHSIASDSYKIDGNYFLGSNDGTGPATTPYPIIELLGKSSATAWVTATAYKSGEIVSNGGTVYIALTDHTSSALFATDLAALKWSAAFDFYLLNMRITDNNFIGGAEVFKFDDPSNLITGNDLIFGATNRVEQTHDVDAYEVYLNANMRHVSFSHWYGGADNADAKNGIYVRNTEHLSLRDWSYVGTNPAKNALNIDNSVNNIIGSNVGVQAGAGTSITGQRYVIWGNSYPTANIPHNFVLQTTDTQVGTSRSDYWQSGSLITLANGAEHILGSSTTSGFLFITNSLSLNAIYGLTGTNAATQEISDPTAQFTTVAGTASSNIYPTYTIAFTGGLAAGIAVGNTITGATSAATAVVSAVNVTSGSFAANNAAGTLTLHTKVGTFGDELITIAGTNRATVDGPTTPSNYVLQNNTGSEKKYRMYLIGPGTLGFAS